MKFFCLLLLFTSQFSFAQSSEEKEIRKVLTIQTDTWNKGNIEGFMQTYWHNDSLLFIGKNGVKWGWQSALDNYKKNYPDTAAMGQLSFDILLIKKLAADYYYVVGKWSLVRSIGDISGHYDILLRKIRGQWVIVADHSS